ncbi:hypothetical protein [Paraburkholderia sp. SIMBA_053]|uniref:hypothetical protein n=1 Tax=Paraburkholderia sp. SIMBA_053 TaxID=3085794 RepID=UPI0039786E4F
MTLTEGFQLLATAPDGVTRLRELILSLAVQGKLVQQDPNDETCDSLLNRIAEEKKRLNAARKVGRDKPTRTIADDETSFDLPHNWRWIRLGVAIELISGQHLGPSEYVEGLGSDIPYLTGPAEFGPCCPEPTRSTTVRRAVAVSGDILITVKGSGVGKLNTVSHAEIAISRQLMAIRPILLNVRFVELALRAMAATFQQNAVGIAIPGIGREDVTEAVIGLPPIAEQARIVAKVDELMHLCDELETGGRLEAEQHARLTATLFDALAASESAHALAENWSRVATHFDLLLDRPEAVDALEQTIFQLAVRGLLIKQEPGDEPADELLKKVSFAKDLLIAKGEIKRGKPLPSIDIDEQRYSLPAGWEWVRLGTLCSVLTDGEHLTPERTNDHSQVPLVTAKNVRDGFMDYGVTDFVPRHVAEKCWARCRPLAQDVLMVSVGATTGRVSILQEDHEMVLVRSVTLFRPVTAGLNPRYLELHLKSPDSQDEIWSSVKRNAQPCLYLAKSACLQIALPPLKEQARIVARVEELRRVCANLRACLAARQICQAYFAEALVEQAASATPLDAHTDGLAAAA